MSKRTGNLLVLALFIFLAGPLQSTWAQIEVSLSSNRSQLTIGEELGIELVVSSTGQVGSFTPVIKGIENFQMIGKTQSSNISIVNGRKTVSQTLTIYLRGNQVGKFELGPASIALNNQTYESNRLAIEVLAQGQTASGSERGDSNPEKQNEDIYLRGEISKKSVYLYEPIRIVYKLYTRMNVEQYSVNALPKTQNFWVEEIPNNNSIKQYNKVINNQKYLVAELQEILVYPTAIGKQTISPFSINCVVRVRSRDPFFDDFFSSSFFSQSQQLEVKSNPIAIDVKPLPSTGRPAGMTDGNVGRFTIQAGVNSTQAKTNEGITFRLTLAGQGNFKMVGEPELTFPDAFTAYKSGSTITPNSDRVSGKMVIEYALVPNRKGSFTIPAVSFHYFDIESYQYKTVSTQPITITVEQGKTPVLSSAAGNYDAREIDLLKQDIRYIKPTPTAIVNQQQQLEWYFWLLLMIGLFSIPLAFIHSSHRNRLIDDRSYARSMGASREAKKRLGKAKQLKRDENIDAFYNELYCALAKYITDRLMPDKSDLNSDEIRALFNARKIDEAVIQELLNFMDHTQLARFSPVKPNQKQKEDDFKLTESLLTRLTRYF